MAVYHGEEETEVCACTAAVQAEYLKDPSLYLRVDSASAPLGSTEDKRYYCDYFFVCSRLRGSLYAAFRTRLR